MLSVRNSGSAGGPALSMEFLGMYFDTGRNKSGVPMNMQKIYGYYDVVPTPKSFIVATSYTTKTVTVTSN